MSEIEQKLLEISGHTIDELLKNSTIHPKREHLISDLQARTMTSEQLYHECLKLLEELKNYPDIVVLKEYVKRSGYFVTGR